MVGVTYIFSSTMPLAMVEPPRGLAFMAEMEWLLLYDCSNTEQSKQAKREHTVHHCKACVNVATRQYKWTTPGMRSSSRQPSNVR